MPVKSAKCCIFEAGKEWNALDQLELVNVGVGGGRKIHHGREGFFLSWYLCVHFIFIAGAPPKKNEERFVAWPLLACFFFEWFFL